MLLLSQSEVCFRYVLAINVVVAVKSKMVEKENTIVKKTTVSFIRTIR